MRIVDNGPEDAILIQMDKTDSTELQAIVRWLMPEWLELFAKKNSDYGAGSAFELGVRGQYSDIHRKMIKLKRAMWDGEELKFEGSEEIIRDLIGHLFLTLHMMEVQKDADRVYAYTEDDAAVDAIFRMMGGDARKAYQMSYNLTPPFGELVRERAAKMMEADALEEMTARSSRNAAVVAHLDAAQERLEKAGMLGPDGEPRLMSRARLLHHTVDAAAASLSSEEFEQADFEQHLPIKVGDKIRIEGVVGSANGDYEVAEIPACSSRGKGFDGPACRCHDAHGYSMRPLRDDDPVHPQDETEDHPEGVPALSPSDLLGSLAAKVEELTTTPEQQAEIKDMLDRLFKNSDKQRELLSRFERRIRGY